MKLIYVVFRDWMCEEEFCSAWESEIDAKKEVLQNEKDWVESIGSVNTYPWLYREVELK